jgi:CheY-like chemotaxis protein
MANILIVDDDYAIRTLYQFVFMEAGHTSELAKNGQEALEKVQASLPDLMLIDISMPVMDGTQFIAELKKLSISRTELGRIPYIVLTGENSMKMNEHYGFNKDPNCRAFLPKMTQQATVLSLTNKILHDSGKA